jgi:hypothetical protein
LRKLLGGHHTANTQKDARNILVAQDITLTSKHTGKRVMTTHRVIAFATTDLESAPEIQAMDAADVDGLSREYRDSGLDVHLIDAQRRGEEIWVPIAGPGDLESVQHYFSPKVRWVSRGEMLLSK